jgi:hypothetical protein
LDTVKLVLRLHFLSDSRESRLISHWQLALFGRCLRAWYLASNPTSSAYGPSSPLTTNPAAQLVTAPAAPRSGGSHCVVEVGLSARGSSHSTRHAAGAYPGLSHPLLLPPAL